MKYISKPVIIEAIKWDGTVNAVEQIGKEFSDIFIEDAILNIGHFADYIDDCPLYIKFLNREMRLTKGDYIIKGLAGEYYSCSEDTFKERYEKFHLEDIEK